MKNFKESNNICVDIYSRMALHRGELKTPELTRLRVRRLRSSRKKSPGAISAGVDLN